MSEMGRAKASERELIEYIESGKRLMAIRFAFAPGMPHVRYTKEILTVGDDAYRQYEKGRSPAPKRVMEKLWAAFPDPFPDFNALRDYIESGKTKRLMEETITALVAVKDEVIAKRIENKWPL